MLWCMKSRIASITKQVVSRFSSRGVRYMYDINVLIFDKLEMLFTKGIMTFTLLKGSG